VLEPTLSTGVKIDELEGIFDKLGKGLHLGWKIKTEIKTETG
jgi:hypothetical protein